MIEPGPDIWPRIEALFAAASRLDADGRAHYLQTECADDPLLRDYVSSLLAADPAIDATVQHTIAETISRAFTATETDSMKGETIGPYRVERLLGTGGMGVVYLAARADQQFEQQVAIKLGRHRLVDPQTESRLRKERQILADLDHPCIARLFDGGTTDQGVPYLVMEYIDGVRLDTYCDLHRLTVRQRLRLFQEICGAVHYAHQNLIIHRDIKAANILVTADGTPKLLDFGIAKLISPEGRELDNLTREGAAIMTPANAAPEQLLGRPVTTATDVYGLGLLLYRLLCGLRAFEADALSPREFALMVCEQAPVRPSQRLQQAPAASAIASDRSTTSDRLQRALAGDLDTIVLSALRKDPARRYRSAAALAHDIDLHLRSMPIVARADSWRYRTGKFLRRHVAAVTASVLGLAVLAAFTVLLLIQNRVVIKERDTAREVSQFLEDIFMAQDPAQARGTSITAEELLATGADRIRSDLKDRPEIQATLMATIGRVYFGLGLYDASARMLEQALQLRLVSLGKSHPDVAAVQNDLAESLIRLPDYPRAEALLNEALAINRRHGGDRSPSVAKNLFNLAELHLKTSEHEAAEVFANASVDIYSQYMESHSIELAEAKNMLARILQVRGDLQRTETLLLEAIEIVSASEGPDHPLMAYYLQNLGVLQRSKGDLDAAEATLKRAVDVTRRVLGENHHLLAATLVNQGTLLHAKGDLVNAEIVLRDALDLHRKTRGENHPMVGYDMTVLGMLLHDKSDLAAAEMLLRGALSVYEESLDDNHQYTASALTALGAVLNSQGKLAEARTTLERAMAIRAQDYSSDHELYAATQAEYADTLTRLGLFDEAEPLLRQSLDALRDRPGRGRQRANEAFERLQRLSAEAAHAGTSVTP